MRKRKVTGENCASEKLREFSERNLEIEMNANKIECVEKTKRQERERRRIYIYVRVCSMLRANEVREHAGGKRSRS